MTQTFDPFDPAEWVDKPGCEAFEMAIDMRARAALAPSAIQVLAAHLGACESCRAHAEAGDRLDAALAATIARAPAEIDWERARRKLEQRIKRARRAPWIATAAGPVGVALFAGVRLVTGEPVRAMTLLMALGLYCPFMAWIHFTVAARRTRELLACPDVIAGYRGELEKSVSRSKILLPLLLISAGINLVEGIEALPGALGGDQRALSTVVMQGILAALMVAASIICLLTWRRERRELAELR
jgi:hypothetical protein